MDSQVHSNHARQLYKQISCEIEIKSVRNGNEHSSMTAATRTTTNRQIYGCRKINVKHKQTNSK